MAKTKTENQSSTSNERKEIEVLNAEYGKGKGYKYKHVDGKDSYEFVEAGAAKCRIDGTWYIAVYYRQSSGMLCCTAADRWRLRFQRVSK